MDNWKVSCVHGVIDIYTESSEDECQYVSCEAGDVKLYTQNRNRIDYYILHMGFDKENRKKELQNIHSM